MKKAYVAALAVAAAATLSACGGGGDCCAAVPGPTEQVPASASASSSGFIAYLVALVASSADTLEPVDTSGVVGPTDDLSEPQVVD